MQLEGCGAGDGGHHSAGELAYKLRDQRNAVQNTYQMEGVGLCSFQSLIQLVGCRPCSTFK